mmetsp:Transcript_86287/g.227552  ORF Transcript_86287/g.227552 Transcript_86287/m.227552 type:complete len:235 (-) Transcript_86287:428-1132(-)
MCSRVHQASPPHSTWARARQASIWARAWARASMARRPASEYQACLPRVSDGLHSTCRRAGRLSMHRRGSGRLTMRLLGSGSSTSSRLEQHLPEEPPRHLGTPALGRWAPWWTATSSRAASGRAPRSSRSTPMEPSMWSTMAITWSLWSLATDFGRFLPSLRLLLRMPPLPKVLTRSIATVIGTAGIMATRTRRAAKVATAVRVPRRNIGAGIERTVRRGATMGRRSSGREERRA